MFDLAFERAHRVLLARFYHIMEPTDLQQLDEAMLGFVREHGPVRELIDLTNVTLIAVPESLLRFRSLFPQTSPGHTRVTVAPQDEIFTWTIAHVAQQHDGGIVWPYVARSIDEAYQVLGLDSPMFTPLVC